MNHADTAAKLVVLANDEGATMEERRTAAFQAAAIMHKHVIAPAHEVSRSFDVEFERTHFLARLKTDYIHVAAKIYEVLAAQLEHPAEVVPGRAELNRLCYALAGVAGDVVLGMPNMEEHISEVRECLGVVAVAFSEWDARQPEANATEVRTKVFALFDTGSVDTHVNTIAAKMHVPVPAVQAALDALVADGLLRLKSGKYSKVKRQPKAKPAPDPRQTDMFSEVAQ